MQAAVVSVLLMAGACGDSSEPLPPPPAIGSAAPSMTQPQSALRSATVEQVDAAPACVPSATIHGAGSSAYLHPWLGGHHDYTPVWFLHDSAVYYPGNYAEPYDYREIFNYPWHGPRPPLTGALASPEFTAKRATSEVRSTYR